MASSPDFSNLLRVSTVDGKNFFLLEDIRIVTESGEETTIVAGSLLSLIKIPEERLCGTVYTV
jgi:hypothetical protein